jgi:2-oxoglutarate ferredoxin oxidoreductase subunit alpha
MPKLLMKGNEAIAEAAIQAGCKCYFGYPITPQSELPEYMAKHMPKRGGVFLQAESEVSAINMVYGAAGAGVRVMTSSSSPGISLKQEGLSYIAGAQLPCVVVNMVRGGPGLGGIQPAQSDYFQAVKGGGHGDYKLITLAPASVQEAVDLTRLAFELADKYRNPVMILGDGMLGQMMEPVEFHEEESAAPDKPWRVRGYHGEGERRIINSLYLEPDALEELNHELWRKYERCEKEEVRYEAEGLEDAELVLVAYGIPARIAQSVIALAADEGVKLGLIRPITLWPFPTDAIREAAKRENVKKFVAFELSMGQMVEDVRLAVEGRKPVEFVGRVGGVVPGPQDLLDEILALRGKA